ncbi:ADP-ribosylation factor GTPase-activating protein AGD12-like [Salvia splendens]|uniref:ADP-ribosylation factor GTPase-activating protein AGD12-like n=1 Tax=Salvia splendens TaxID=180675 RepID=UPI0011039E18|nr:ADP-ribosylation factor GTPase-activating protein AGD12-like [Salvia splendens]
MSTSALGRPSSGKRRLKDLLGQSDNRVCADCEAPDPKWASSNIGVFLCLKCCGVHRSLGANISKVLSVALDDWDEEDIEAVIEVGGNASANSIYESYLPEGVSKPAPDAGHEERTQFIKSKYEQQAFLKPSLRIQSGSAAKNSSQVNSTREIVNSKQSSNSAEDSEYIGKMKVKVLRGSNLAVRDMLSSDPYIVLTLGKQKVQTSVVSSNLNPVWNEELLLSIPHDYSPVKLQVYDQDTFSADDIMGEADIDMQPMINSAMAFGDAKKFSDMQIGKWLKSYDNALIEDSPVNIVAGKVRQELWLRLQNVESGEVELELEWLPL